MQSRTRKLQVYVLAPSFPPALGGQEIHLAELSESLVAAGVGVRVIAATRALPEAGYVDTLPVVRVPTYGKTQGGGWRSLPWVALLLCRIIWRLLRDVGKYDVVLVSGFNVMPLAPVIAGLFTRKPCVVRPESPLELEYVVGEASRSSMGVSSGSMLIRFATRLRRLGAARIERYIAISGEIRSRLIADGIDPAKIVDISNGINTNKFLPATPEVRTRLRAELGLPPDKLLLIYTGRLAVTKGVMILMEVWGELAPLHPAAHLLLVGSGGASLDDCEPDARRFVADHALCERVTFVGAVANVHEYLQAADIFVFPSFFEGFGLSILEAMAVGLPMVCTRVGVAADLEPESGIRMLVSPQVKGEFRDSLQRLLAEPNLRRRVGSKARETVRGLYSMDTVARHHAAVFAELAGDRS
jgi:glycosyltransferase involved in cell wall biosynthesis